MELVERVIGNSQPKRPVHGTARPGAHRRLTEEHVAALVLAATGLPVGPGVAACARAACAALASMLATGTLTPWRKLR